MTSSSLVTSPPVIMAPRADGCEVVWGVARLSRGWVEWERDGERGVLRADAFGMTPQHDQVLRVRVSGFPEGSETMLRAVTEAIDGVPERHESGWRSVRTLTADAESAHLAVWNDTHQNDETISALHAITPDVDMLVWNGDLCNDWKAPDAFTRTILNPAGLEVSAGRPLSIVMGNHDVRGHWAYRLQEFVATADGRPYSAGRVGPVAFVTLHTGEDKPDDHPTFHGRVAFEQLRAQQADWLNDVLRTPQMRDAPYRVVFCHIPLRWIDESPVDYDDGGYDWFSLASRDAWHGALTRWGAQLVVSGHTHHAVALAPTADFPYAQVIGGGPDSDPGSAEAATWIEITADAAELSCVARRLDGSIVIETRIPPLHG